MSKEEIIITLNSCLQMLSNVHEHVTDTLADLLYDGNGDHNPDLPEGTWKFINTLCDNIGNSIREASSELEVAKTSIEDETEPFTFEYPFNAVPPLYRMTEEEFNKKWKDVVVEELDDEKFVEFKRDCYLMYETTGFSEKFHSPYEDEGGNNGKAFKVIRRANVKEVDLEAMPIWVVEIEGEEGVYFCYPEEICKAEEKEGK